MFAWHRLQLGYPFTQVQQSFAAGPAAWIPDLIEEPSGRFLCTISANFGGHLQRRAELGIGQVESGEGWLSVPISWRAAEADVLFPVFAGEVHATRLPGGHTELALVGSYQPPLGAVGELVDRAVMHRVADQALAALLARVCERVAPLAGDPAPIDVGNRVTG